MCGPCSRYESKPTPRIAFIQSFDNSYNRLAPPQQCHVTIATSAMPGQQEVSTDLHPIHFVPSWVQSVEGEREPITPRPPGIRRLAVIRVVLGGVGGGGRRLGEAVMAAAGFTRILVLSGSDRWQRGRPM